MSNSLEGDSMKKNKKYTNLIIYFVVLLLLVLPSFIFKKFGKLDLEQIIFLFVSDGAGADFTIVFDYFKYALPRVAIIYLVTILIRWAFRKYGERFMGLKWIQKIANFVKTPKFLSKSLSKGVIVTILVALFLNQQFDVAGYLLNSQEVTYLYEQHYVHPNQIQINFPKEKRNLVYIVLESMNTNFSEIELEEETVNLIPNIQELANENVMFSHHEGFGGFQHLRGLTWTVASLVGQTSGVPLNVPMKRNRYGKNGHFLPGITTLGEILEENGYSNYFLMGSDGNFAGRETYFRTHGNYEIYDTKYLKEIGYIPEDYDVFWGMEDLKLFDFAKTKLLEIAEKDEPFNFSMLTVDSHYPEGYIDETCELPYESAYANAISCSDLKIIEFVEWLQEQDFYENTTVILTGDHNTMNNEFLELTVEDPKTIYNTFLNLPFTVEEDVLVNREFSALDMFPTTLAALGVEIEGDRLGLGSNLFSGKKTLIEKLSIEYIDVEFSKKSQYYNKEFFIK